MKSVWLDEVKVKEERLVPGGLVIFEPSSAACHDLPDETLASRLERGRSDGLTPPT